MMYDCYASARVYNPWNAEILLLLLECKHRVICSKATSICSPLVPFISHIEIFMQLS